MGNFLGVLMMTTASFNDDNVIIFRVYNSL